MKKAQCKQYTSMWPGVRLCRPRTVICLSIVCTVRLGSPNSGEANKSLENEAKK